MLKKITLLNVATLVAGFVALRIVLKNKKDTTVLTPPVLGGSSSAGTDLSSVALFAPDFSDVPVQPVLDSAPEIETPFTNPNIIMTSNIVKPNESIYTQDYFN